MPTPRNINYGQINQYAPLEEGNMPQQQRPGQPQAGARGAARQPPFAQEGPAVRFETFPTQTNNWRQPQVNGFPPGMQQPFFSPAYQPYAQPGYLPQPQPAHLLPQVPAMAPALAGGQRPMQLGDLNHVLQKTRNEINTHLAKHPLQNNAGRLVTILGTLGAIGAGVATGVAVLTGTFGALSGIGIPVAAAAALGGVGIGLAGIGVAAMAGAATRAIGRRAVAQDPHLRSKIAALQEMQTHLLAQPKLTKADQVLLRNVNVVLGKVGGMRGHIKSQMKVAAKTTGVAALSVLVLAALGLVEYGDGGGVDSFYFIGGSPLQGLSFDVEADGSPLKNHQGQLTLDPQKLDGWYHALRAAP